ncbi:MAG: hypothetical protein KF911_02915 [Pseudomonadales bacterium]|nr:hypothetical protein [Pseudomonadales bacterium]
MNTRQLIVPVWDSMIMVAAVGGVMGCMWSLAFAALLASVSIANRIRHGRFMWPPHPFGQRPQRSGTRSD